MLNRDGWYHCDWCGNDLSERKVSEGDGGAVFCSRGCLHDHHGDAQARAASQAMRASEGRMAKVASFVAREYGLPDAAIHSPARAKRAVLPRQIACWVIKSKYGYSFDRIGKNIGNRDHTTALWAVTRITDLRAADPGFRDLTDDLLARAP